MRTAITLALFALLATACGGSKDDAKPGSAKPTADKAAANPDDAYKKIDELVAAARTSDDFLNIIVECGGMEIEQAAAGGGDLAKDPTYQQHCVFAPKTVRAELAIKGSTPDKMSEHCISASMGLDELIEAGKIVDQAKPLLEKVNKACDLD